MQGLCSTLVAVIARASKLYRSGIAENEAGSPMYVNLMFVIGQFLSLSSGLWQIVFSTDVVLEHATVPVGQNPCTLGLSVSAKGTPPSLPQM